MTHQSPRGFLWLAAFTILLSAFLLFQVQPLISKAILPWFGGSPAVWSTAMLFFQLLLLAGYAYADLLVRLPSQRLQMIVHSVLLIAALATLPIVPSDRWKPASGEYPTQRILWVLAVSVGAPYFLLSTTGPLVQVWFARATGGASPYRLYALSNIGSLAALITYPFLFERLFEVPTQGWVWSGGFIAFAVTCGLVGWQSLRSAASPEMLLITEDSRRPAALDYAAWVLLPALAVVSLLAVTNHLCRDVAVVPFLWIAPLTLYLLSFILCFDREAWYARRSWGLLGAVLCLAVLSIMLASHVDRLYGNLVGFIHRYAGPLRWLSFTPSKYLRLVLVEGPIYLAWLMCGCMLCHGELVRRKPAAGRLTTFYLCIAAGGAVGGIFVALVCPIVFSNYWELYLAVGGVYVVAASVAALEFQRDWFRRSKALWVVYLLLAASGGFLWMWAVSDTLAPGATSDKVIAQVRDFYGVLTVKEHLAKDPEHHGYGLYNGRILHGFQYLDPARRKLPISYYGENSGPAIVVERLRATRGPLRFGVVGLGTGTMAAYGRAGDSICFYEIDPQVIAIQNRYFHYLHDCQAEVTLEVGDARIQMERQLARHEPQQFDALFIDAFSGDAVPTHLLTREALALYRRHLGPNGIIVYHVSNRYLDLNPIILGLARDAKLGFARFEESKATNKLYDTSSTWIAVTADRSFLEDEIVLQQMDGFESPHGILWTDQYSNLWDVLR